MLSFDQQFETRIPLSHGLVRTLTTLHEFRGKEQLFRQQTPQVLEALRQSAVIQSVESSNRIEGVVAKRGRVKEIVAAKSEPRDRSEAEIAGYRDVLDTIHGGHEDIRLSNGVVKQFHRMLFEKTPDRGDMWKADAVGAWIIGDRRSWQGSPPRPGDAPPSAAPSASSGSPPAPPRGWPRRGCRHG